jgi:hypothetical protein
MELSRPAAKFAPTVTSFKWWTEIGRHAMVGGLVGLMESSWRRPLKTGMTRFTPDSRYRSQNLYEPFDLTRGARQGSVL